MDPEDLREVISAYQKCVAETVQRFGGFVAKYMGDGVLVYFGYPQAHEDDAERAVRAGLELVQAVGGLKFNAPLQSRVAIATGLVVVGDLIGSGAAQEQTVVGETPNLAARLQGDCRTEHGRHCREHAKTSRQFVRAARPWRARPQGHRGAGAGLGGAACFRIWGNALAKSTCPWI
jgi:class 3 adenylate cyclase